MARPSIGEWLRERAADRSPWNCSTDAADWCMALGHPDFAEEWREVTDPDECAEIAAYGLVELWDIGIGDALPVVEGEPEPGDIAVVTAKLPGAREQGLEAGAIWTGERWAMRLPKGLLCASPDYVTVIKAWRP